LAVLALIGGAVVSVLVAEGIGVSGLAHYNAAAPQRFVAVGGQYVHARDMRGLGWRYLLWSAMGQRSAAVAQYMYDNPADDIERMPAQSYVHLDPPDSLPQWSRLWDAANWPPAQRMDAWDQREEVIEVGVGFPMTALSMDCGEAQPKQCRGGRVLSRSVYLRMRALLWRPIPLGLAADTLFYAVGVAGLVGGGRFFVRRRRRRRGACAACGYDRRGLAAGVACPECGQGL
jgi:hypothetical protein